MADYKSSEGFMKFLKATQREARKAIRALKELEELEEQKKDKYLVIVLEQLGDVPKIYYKGEEITLKEFVNFQWTTRTEVPGSTDIIVDYYKKQDGKLIKKSIREGVKL